MLHSTLYTVEYSVYYFTSSAVQTTRCSHSEDMRWSFRCCQQEACYYYYKFVCVIVHRKDQFGFWYQSVILLNFYFWEIKTRFSSVRLKLDTFLSAPKQIFGIWLGYSYIILINIYTYIYIYIHTSIYICNSPGQRCCRSVWKTKTEATQRKVTFDLNS